MAETEPMDQPKAPMSTTKKVGAGVGVAAMLAIAVPYTTGWEGGAANDPWFDKIGKVETVCIGDTQVEMKHYSDEQCAAMLRDKLSKVYAPAVEKALHGIDDHKFAFAAFTDLAYNAGPGAVAQSIARLWNGGQYVAACHYISNYKIAGGKVVAGLVYRRDGQAGRIGEVDLCMVDAVRMQLGVD